MQNPVTKLAYSPEEFAEATGLHLNTVYRELRAGHLKSKRVGKRWVIPVSVALEYLNDEKPRRGGAA